jgi:hypothetical protein
VWLSNDQMQPAAFTQGSVMPALGQKRTLGRVHPMSALPPKADIGTQPRNVRFVPKAAVSKCSKNPLLRLSAAVPGKFSYAARSSALSANFYLRMLTIPSVI